MCVFVSVTQRCMLKLLVFLLLSCYCNISSAFVKIIISLKCNIFLLLIETVKSYSHVWYFDFVLSCTILTENRARKPSYWQVVEVGSLLQRSNLSMSKSFFNNVWIRGLFMQIQTTVAIPIFFCMLDQQQIMVSNRRAELVIYFSLS